MRITFDVYGADQDALEVEAMKVLGEFMSAHQTASYELTARPHVELDDGSVSRWEAEVTAQITPRGRVFDDTD